MEIERTVFVRLEEHARHVNNTYKKLGQAIKAWIEEDKETFDKAVSKIKQSEKKSREIKNEALNDVARGISIYRGDFLRLILKMEDCASYQGGAAARLARLPYVPKKNDPMIGKFMTLIDIFIKMGDLLLDLMKSLSTDLNKAHTFCDEIDVVEESVDDAYRDLESYLYSRTDLDIRIIMQLREILKHIEEACDHVQSTADSVRIILASH